MSLRPQPPLPPVPDDTARIARAAFRRGNPYVLLDASNNLLVSVGGG